MHISKPHTLGITILTIDFELGLTCVSSAALEGNADQVAKCRNKLFSTDPKIDRRKLKSEKGKRAKGTCEWITIKDNSYLTWKKSDSRLLWLHGGPGKGKTMLSIFLTERMEIEGQTIYYFCSARDERRNSATHVLRGLLWQLLGHQPELAGHLRQRLDDSTKMQSAAECRDTLWTMLMDVVHDSRMKQTYCLLDGLDECDIESQRWLAAELSDLISPDEADSKTVPLRLKIMIVSRDTRGLSDLRRCEHQLNLDLDNDNEINEDLAKFVRSQVQSLSEKLVSRSSDQLPKWVEKELFKRARGTFLWVGYAMHELRQVATWIEVEEIVGGLPPGLTALYDRMLLQIQQRHAGEIVQVLRWVVTAFRPLSLMELAGAVGCGPIGKISIEQVITDKIKLCEPLITIEGQTVNLVHESVREYLSTLVTKLGPSHQIFAIQPSSAHLDLGRACIEIIEDKYRNQRHDDAPRTRFHNYAMVYWPEHARQSNQRGKALVDECPAFFADDSGVMRAWWRRHEWRCSCYQADLTPIFHLACFLRIPPWASDLMKSQNMSDPLCLDQACMKALLCVSSRGYIEGIHLLKELGARFDAKNESGRTALHVAAAVEGNDTTVQTLIELGADVHAKDNDGRTALEVATTRGNHTMVRTLVTLGADVGAQDRDGQTMLHREAMKGNNAMVRTLADLGADIDAQDRYGQTTLHREAMRGNNAMVLLLDELGASIAVRDDLGQTALHTAAVWRIDDLTVRALVELGADVHAKDESGQRALHAAAARGNDIVARTLFELGANIHAKDGLGRTALHSATAWPFDDLAIQVLAKLGADVHAKDKSGQTALHAAAARGNDIVARTLFELGANIHAKDEEEQTALHVAASAKGNDTTAQVLVELGVDLYAIDKMGRTALDIAKLEGNSRAVTALVELGADIHLKDKAGRTVLHKKAMQGNHTTVRALVELGADVHATDLQGQTALHVAAGHPKNAATIRVLVELGASIHAKDRTGRTARDIAIANGYDVVGQVLGIHPKESGEFYIVVDGLDEY